MKKKPKGPTMPQTSAVVRELPQRIVDLDKEQAGVYELFHAHGALNCVGDGRNVKSRLRKTLLSMFAVLFLASFLEAQTNQAAMAANPHQVKQGEQVKIQVSVSPSPNVPGTVTVFVAPEGSTETSWPGGNGVGPGQTAVGEIGITIPVDGRIGRWQVFSVRFRPAGNGSPERDLKFSPEGTAFEVIKRETVVPTSANVQVK
jgi:hypothetical protein